MNLPFNIYWKEKLSFLTFDSVCVITENKSKTTKCTKFVKFCQLIINKNCNV